MTQAKRRFVKMSLTRMDRAMLVIGLLHRSNVPQNRDLKFSWEQAYWAGETFKIIRKHEIEDLGLRDIRNQDAEKPEPEDFRFPPGCYNTIRKCLQEVDWWRVDQPEDLANLLRKFGLEASHEGDEKIEGPVEIVEE